MPFHSLTQHQNAEARCAPRFIHALVARRTSRTRDVARRAVCRRKSERRAASPAHPNAPAPARRQGGSSGHERVRGAKAPPPARAPRRQSATRTSVSHRNTGHTHTYMLCIIYILLQWSCCTPVHTQAKRRQPTQPSEITRTLHDTRAKADRSSMLHGGSTARREPSVFRHKVHERAPMGVRSRGGQTPGATGATGTTGAGTSELEPQAQLAADRPRGRAHWEAAREALPRQPPRTASLTRRLHIDATPWWASLSRLASPSRL